MATRVLDSDFLAAVKTGRQSVKRSTLPVLTHVLLKIERGFLQVISTDLETVSRGEVGALSDTDWELCVPAKPLFDWLRSRKPKAKAPQTLELESMPRLATLVILADGVPVAHFKGIDAQEFPLIDFLPAEGDVIQMSKYGGPKTPEARKAVDWVNKAAAQGHYHPELSQTFYTEGQALASDGYRLHRIKGEYSPSVDAKVPDIYPVISQAHNTYTRTVVDADQLANLAKQALSFDRNAEGKHTGELPLRLRFGASGLTASASSDVGSWQSALLAGDTIPPVVYKHSGPSLKTVVNLQYLIDSLSGMSGEVTIRASKEMISLTAGKREAVIMGMHLGK